MPCGTCLASGSSCTGVMDRRTLQDYVSIAELHVMESERHVSFMKISVAQCEGRVGIAHYAQNAEHLFGSTTRAFT